MRTTTRSGLAVVAAGMATALVAGLAAWGVSALLARRGRIRWWPFIGSTALAISLTGPSYLADGISAVCLICLHFLVGVVLIAGFMRALTRPPHPADQAAGYRPSRG